MNPLLETELTIRYGQHTVVRGAKLDIGPGEILGLAGLSGSGKSTLALALLRLLDHRKASVSGRLAFEGRELLDAPESEWRKVRGRRISLVLQSAESALNPAMRLEEQLGLAWRIHSMERTGRDRARALFSQCGLPDGAEFLRRYPSQISVGQAQRVLIAMALLHEPALLVADEITSALDPLTRQEVINALKAVNRDARTAILFVSHDIQALRCVADRIAILHEGEVVECAPPEQLFRRPSHPFTSRLVSAAANDAASAPGDLCALNGVATKFSTTY